MTNTREKGAQNVEKLPADAPISKNLASRLLSHHSSVLTRPP